MKDRHETLLRALLEAVGGAGGKLDPTVRRDLLEGKAKAGALGEFATKVAENPGSINEEHFASLRAAGVHEESIFDCIVAAAIGSGLVRLRAALRAIAETR